MDVYQEITDKIVAAIENGAEGGKWEMPWHRITDAAWPTSVAGREYRGLNPFILDLTAESRGYPDALWGTFNAWKGEGAMVRKGEKATVVYFWMWPDKTKGAPKADEGDDEKPGRSEPWVKAFWVFNVAQVDDYDAEAWRAKREAKTAHLTEPEKIARAETTLNAYMAAHSIPVIHKGNRAFYRRTGGHGGGEVHMPERRQFKSSASYYSVLGHECGHSTGDKGRLEREYGKRFGDEAYAFEELVAELTAAFLSARLGIAVEPREDHAQYLASWLRVLKGNKRAIFTAAAHAQKAADLILKHDPLAAPVETVATMEEAA